MFDTAHIHPMLVHFPIALALLGCLLEFISLVKKNPSCCGEILLYFATVAAILAATAGSLFTPNFTTEKLIQAKDIHGMMGGITVTMLCIASTFYIATHLLKKYAPLLHKIGFAFYLLGAIAVAIAGFLGGVIVYNDLLKM